MTSPVPSAFNNQELHGLQRDRRAGSKSIAWEQSAPGSQRVCTSPLRYQLLLPAEPLPVAWHRASLGTARCLEIHLEECKNGRSRQLLTGFFFPLQVLGGFCSLPRPAESASTAASTFHPAPTPSVPKTDLKCQDLQLGPRPSWVPAQGREAAGGCGSRARAVPPCGTQRPQTPPRPGAGDVRNHC